MLTAAFMTKVPPKTATLSVAFDTNCQKESEAFADLDSSIVFLKLAILSGKAASAPSDRRWKR